MVDQSILSGGAVALPPFGSRAAIPAQAQTSASRSNGSAVAVAPTPVIPTPNAVDVSIDSTPGMVAAPFPMDIDAEFQDATRAVEFARDRSANAESFIGQLGDLAANLAPPTINPEFPTLGSAPAITVPVAPALQPVTYQPPEVPAAFTEAIQVAVSFPGFTAEQPQLAFPSAPLPPVQAIPDTPAVDLNFVYPEVDVTLPDAPQLLSIAVEQFQGVDFPTLNAKAPTLTAIEPSLVTYIPAAPYTDTLLSSLKSVLQRRLDMGNTGANTGLPPAIEQGIWNRGREREARSQADALAQLDRMETMGYTLPPGAWVDARIKAYTETHYTNVGNSREVAVEQAKLEQENIKSSLDQAAQIEAKLIDYANQTEQRRFEAMRYMTEAGVSIYNAQVQAYSARTVAYRANIEVFTAQIEGAKAQVQIYTAKIEAEKLKVDANNGLLQGYKIRVDAALASIEVFKGEISLVQARAGVERLKVDIFGEQVRAYAAEAQMFATSVEAYKAGVEAQTAKQAAYATAAQAYGTLVQATSKEIDASIEVYKVKLAAKAQDVETYKARVQSEAERVRAIAAHDQAVTQLYSATVQGTASYNSALVETYKTQQTIAEQVVQIGVSAAEANGKLYTAVAQIASDAAKVGAQVEAQLGASAIGAVTFATHKSRTDNLGYSQSISFGQSKSVSAGHSTSEGVSTSVSYSSSTSVAASTTSSQGYSESTNIAEAQ